MDKDPARQLRNSWEENAEAWTEAVRTGAIESRKLVTDAAIVRAVLAYGPRTVLDVGCGEGWLARVLAGHGIEVVGIDASLPLIEAARKSGGARFEHYAYAELSGGSLGAPFDTIVCNFSLLEEDLVPTLATLRQMLRPDGHLLIQTVHPWTASQAENYEDGWRLERFEAMGEGFKTGMPWYFRTLASWTGLLERSGFAIERMEEPRHPETGQMLSLLFVAQPS